MKSPFTSPARTLAVAAAVLAVAGVSFGGRALTGARSDAGAPDEPAASVAPGGGSTGAATTGSAKPATTGSPRLPIKRGPAPELPKLLILEAAPQGFGPYESLTGPVDINGAAGHLFGHDAKTRWLEAEGYVEGYQRTWVTAKAPRRVIATTIYRFEQATAPARLVHSTVEGESTFEVPDYAGYVTTGTDSTMATSDRIGTYVPDFVVRMDIEEYMIFVEVSGPGAKAADAIRLAQAQFERAATLLPHVRRN